MKYRDHDMSGRQNSSALPPRAKRTTRRSGASAAEADKTHGGNKAAGSGYAQQERGEGEHL
jgi:hypothetical protein